MASRMTGNTDDVRAALAGMGLAGPGEAVALEALGGGVSCDVFLVKTPARRLVVKRALPKLRVAADWRAPAERSHAEVAWIELVAGIEPKWVPKILGEDRARHVFAMEYFPPEHYPGWKSLLAQGKADAAFAAQVGRALGRIHGATAGREEVARAFANSEQFHALRVEAYLLFTAGRHPDVATRLLAMAKNLEEARLALMQGDISPKNILSGPEGPVFLDAETCSYGDPAFDLAFCLNHLLLKGVWHPEFAAPYAACFAALKEAYFAEAGWEDRKGLEARTAGLLSAFLLARIDGKSPVEFLTDEPRRNFVRRLAKEFLGGSFTLAAMLKRWTEALPAPQM